MSGLARSENPQALPERHPADASRLTESEDYFQSKIKTISKSALVYNWFSTDKSSPLAQHISSGDPIGYEDFQRSASKFWKSYGQGEYDYYGAGLYAAVDPVFSESYSGRDDAGGAWEVLQIQLPIGFRFIDVNRGAKEILPVAVKRDMESYGCHFVTLEDVFIQSGKHSAPIEPTCLAHLTEVFDHDLQLDGFTYRFGSQFYAACNMPEGPLSGVPSSLADARFDRPSAFIITNSRRFQASDIRIFNAQTSDSKPNRHHIESMFVKALAEDPPFHVDSIDDDGTEVLSLLKILKKRFPEIILDLTVTGFEQQRHDEADVRHYHLSVTACLDASRCFMATPSRHRGPPPTSIVRDGSGMYRLHWPDLLNSSIDNTSEDEFIKANFFGCGDSSNSSAQH